MLIPLVQVAWQHPVVHLPHADELVTLRPETAYPNGRRGQCMALVWRTWSEAGAAGVLWIDGDVAADPITLDAMRVAIKFEPDAVHTAPLLMWPAATGREIPMWSHRIPRGEHMDFATDLAAEPHWFALGLTYTPRLLLDDVADQLEQWTHPDVDTQLSRWAQTLGVRVRLVRGAHPVHMHW